MTRPNPVLLFYHLLLVSFLGFFDLSKRLHRIRIPYITLWVALRLIRDNYRNGGSIEKTTLPCQPKYRFKINVEYRVPCCVPYRYQKWFQENELDDHALAPFYGNRHGQTRVCWWSRCPKRWRLNIARAGKVYNSWVMQIPLWSRKKHQKKRD